MKETNEGKKEFKIEGIPAKIYLPSALLVGAAFLTGSLDTDMLSTMAFLFALGAACYAIGESYPGGAERISVIMS